MQIALELEIGVDNVRAVIDLLDDNATVPFIARYRKEKTGSLDELQIRNIQERNAYLIELYERKNTVIKSIEEQNRLTPELKNKILAATTKSELEDLYLPYKPKRRTRATIAKEKGLEPLALFIMQQNLENPYTKAEEFINPEFELNNVQEVLTATKDIIAENIAENAEVRAMLRSFMTENGIITTQKSDKLPEGPSKFEQYFDFSEPVKNIKSHRFLAIRRGEKEGALKAVIEINKDNALDNIERLILTNKSSPSTELIKQAALDALERLLLTAMESDIRIELKQTSDREAVDVFAQNLKNLLLASPLGRYPVIGIDPGLRTGCKCAAIDETGKFLEYININPHTSANTEKTEKDTLNFINKHKPFAVAIGNGTAGRETENFIRDLLPKINMETKPHVIMVNESGASIYSASDTAREEFPELDLTIRGAISIARRLQDPLAELVKIDPKSIGVGQYQHDVYQPLLKKKLDEVVETCVNHVGVELNTASAQLLQYVAGIGPSVAKNILEYRNAKGSFVARNELLKVPGLGPKTFQQAAGFLRIADAQNPLDASAVHPETYPTVQNIADDLQLKISDLIGNNEILNNIPVEKYTDENIGTITLQDIIQELKKPGRDPRDKFEAVKFDEKVRELQDLKIGMILDGIVTNVTHFGAFVDIGVHQDGLVHISNLANTFVTDPNTIVKVGQSVKVKIIELDIPRKRIGLSRKLEETPTRKQRNTTGKEKKEGKSYKNNTFTNNPFADLKRK